MLQTRLVTAIALLSVWAPATPARAQEPTAVAVAADTLLGVEKYMDWETVADPRISPDGRQIVYTRRWINKLKDTWESSIWIMDADGSRARHLIDGSGARWSPDGTRILYLAPGTPRGTQIHIRWMDAEGATSQVSQLLKDPGDVTWSPDGKSIAFTMLVDPVSRESFDIAMPRAPEGAQWTKAPRIVESMHFRQDRRGFVEEGYRHLFVIPVTGGSARQLTRGDWNVGARQINIDGGATIAWSPDSREILFDGFVNEDTDMRMGESYIYSVDVDGGRIRRLVRERGFWAGPSISPDGRTVVFAGYPFTEQTYHVGELYTVGANGEGMRKLAPELDRDVGAITWAEDGSRFFFYADDRGTRNIYSATPRGEVRKLTEGMHMLSLGSLSRTGTAVGVLSSPHEPGDIVTFDVRTPARIARLTDVNADVLKGVKLGKLEEIWYTSTNGTRVQGWIVQPPGFDPSRKYPMIMEIHGGPHGMYNVAFSYMYQNFAANGYVVLYTNPRGSTGYGTNFGNAIDDAYPSVDHDDLMAGVDALVAKGYVDSDRMFVGGCSGGGVLSSWAVGHTDRFAAAAVRCPVINWISFAGTADVALWAYRRFRKPFWEDPMKWLQHSPLMYAPKVKTPVMLMTGELDLRTPMSQSEEYFQALKMAGVPVKLVRFNEEFHGTSSKPSNFIRTQLYMMKWYESWGGAKRWRPAAN
jgi:dipeptidyl aminopeptidase/acylaminoacyl peptidase